MERLSDIQRAKFQQQQYNNEMELEDQTTSSTLQENDNKHFGPKLNKNKVKGKITKKTQNKVNSKVMQVIQDQQEKNYEQMNLQKQEAMIEEMKEQMIEENDNEDDYVNMGGSSIVRQRQQQQQQENKMLVEQQKTMEQEMRDNEIQYLLQSQNQVQGQIVSDYKNFRFDYFYSGYYIADYINDEPDFSNSLQKHNINDKLRAKMVDWLIEVSCNFHSNTLNETYFRAINIMDLYFKKTQNKKVLIDNNVHKIGITSLLIASKMEDIYHITLKDMIEKVAHHKYTAEEFKRQEKDIMEALEYDTSFPTVYEYLKLYHYMCFQNSDQQYIQNFLETAILTLKMCMIEYEMLNYKPSVLALGCIIYSIDCYFDSLYQNMSQNDQNLQLLKKQEEEIKFQFCQIGQNNQIPLNTVEECISIIKDMVSHFPQKYPNLVNLMKFQNLN